MTSPLLVHRCTSIYNYNKVNMFMQTHTEKCYSVIEGYHIAIKS